MLLQVQTETETDEGHELQHYVPHRTKGDWGFVLQQETYVITTNPSDPYAITYNITKHAPNYTSALRSAQLF